jgi:hypothetical protein
MLRHRRDAALKQKNNGYDGKKGNGYERSVALQGDTRKKKNIYVAL